MSENYATDASSSTDCRIDAPRAFARRAARRVRVPADVEERLFRPRHGRRVAVPIERDDGGVEVFDGYRVGHDDARGPFLGPHRYHPDLDADACAGLAAALTWTAAVADVPFGGAAGGVAVDPDALSRRERVRLTRSYAERIAGDVGPDEDVLVPDVGTDELTMARFADALADRTDGPYRATVVGKPTQIGGPPGFDGAAGRSVALGAQETLEDATIPVSEATVAVHGFGAVGATAARLLDSWGASVVAVCDDRGGVAAPGGLDTQIVPGVRDRARPVTAYDGGVPVDPDDVLACDADVLILAAPGETVTARTADAVEASIVVEGTYGGVTPRGQRVLAERDVTVVPDVLANVGSVVAAHLEWVQSVGRDRWSEPRVRNELGYALVGAWDDVRNWRADAGTWRDAAYELALSRVAGAYEVCR